MVVGGKFGHREGPPWLAKLLSIVEFFGHCTTHVTGRNEKNHFCFDCQMGPLCPVGVAESHAGHATVQIRKASHRDVVRVVDIHKLLDFSNIQLYTINSAKILFLQSRPQQKMTKGVPHYCHTCHRSIADPVHFCSLLCKLTGIRQNTHDFTLSFTLQGSSTQSGDMSGSTLADFYPTTPKSKARGRKATHINKELSASNKKRKIQLLGMGNHGDDQLYTDTRHREQSPSSVLMPAPELLTLSEFQQVFSPSLVGPSTPGAIELLSTTTRVRQRKQVHPLRAPLF